MKSILAFYKRQGTFSGSSYSPSSRPIAPRGSDAAGADMVRPQALIRPVCEIGTSPVRPGRWTCLGCGAKGGRS